MSEGNGHAATEAERELEVHRHLMRFGEAESRVAPVWSMRDTSVSAVADHLARLWTMAGDEGLRVTEKGLPHARASVLNLIVTVPDEPSAGRVVETMMGLGFRHPSRAIVLVASPGGAGPTVDAAVSAHCHTPHQAEEQVCYEEVVLTVRGEAASHLDGIVAPLLIHDLPTLVWWPGDPPFVDPVFDQLVELSDKLIIDSSDFSDLLLGYRRLANLRRRSGVGDLAWKRLGWWQELTAQFFDAPRFRRYLPNLNRVRISYALPPESGVAPAPDPHDVAPGARSPIAQAILYASWIASRLTWKRYSTDLALENGQLGLTLEGRYAMVELQISGVPTAAAPPGDLLSVRLRAHGETGAAEFIIDRDGDECIVASNADGMTAQLRRARMEQPLESELLATSLVADRHDGVYEAAIRAAAIFLAAARPAEEAG
ncbi:MAG TPA: glucose-6-phosphate dehydrogenase assembly protein OpcA [Candidatus Limnocylindria bacterium]|jgi:glucose-6-phosphate dehydrogenase assembly protein OpcA